MPGGSRNRSVKRNIEKRKTAGRTEGGAPPGEATQSRLSSKKQQNYYAALAFETLGMDAVKVIEKAIGNGDLATAKWLVEGTMRSGSARIPDKAFGPISTLSTMDINDLSRMVVTRALAGQLSEAQTRFAQDTLSRHVMIAATRDLESMRRQLEALAQESGGQTINATLAPQLPSWGRFRDRANGAAQAEDAEELQ